MLTTAPRPSDKAEEVLETLYGLAEEHRGARLPWLEISLHGVGEGLEELFLAELVRLRDGQLELTPVGYDVARQVIRRHRLAERLLADVLEVRQEHIEDAACGMEHSLRQGVDEAVCALLGHPQTCPHGKPIPAGECCRRAAEQAEQGVAILPALRPNQVGRIAFVRAADTRQLHKLMAMGVLPGKEIKLIQRFPSYVFAVGHSQFAVDEGMARAIHVRVEDK